MNTGLDCVSIRLIKDRTYGKGTKVTNPSSAVKLLHSVLQEYDKELVCVINLKTDGTPINCNIVSQGTVNYSVVHPREIMKSAILSNAAGIIMMHNHLGSNVMPSKSDIEITNRMVDVCELMDIPLYDHIITCADSDVIYSFLEKDALPNPQKLDYSKLNKDLLYSAQSIINNQKAG